MRLRQCTRRYLVAVATLIAGRDAVAQTAPDSIGPRQGTWGVEASYGPSMGASALRFSSPRTAWMLGVSFAVGQETADRTVDYFSGATARSTNTVGTVEVRAGHRWWTGDLNQPLRPFVGLGLGSRYSTASSARMYDASVFGELGATYFFGPHVSLGGAGELAIVREHFRFDTAPGPGATSDSWYVRGDVARLTAAVYF
jgi:hypothetical protein